MKKLLLSVFVLGISFGADAQQSFTRPGTIWHYGNPDQLGTGLESFYTYTALRDTSIAGDIYSQIAYKNYNDVDYGNSVFLTKSNDSIYYLSPSKGKLLLFKTGVNVHDTIAIDLLIPYNADSVINARIVIDSIVWIQNSIVANDSICQWQFHAIDDIETPINTGKYTEKVITSIRNSSPEFIVLLDRVVTLGESPYLRCYQDTQYLFRPEGGNGAVHPCDFVNIVGLKELTQKYQLVNIYPNPAHGFIYITQPFAKNAEVSIYNHIGQLVFTATVAHDQPIDISSFHSGLYYLKLNGDENTFYHNSFIKE